MGKSVHNDVLDTSLTKVATCTRQSLCSSEPANYAAIAAASLANATMAGGDYTIADGDTSGRKVTVGPKATQSVDATGAGTHIALDDGTTLLYVTTCDSTAVTSGGTVDFPGWDIEIADPS